MDIIQRLRFAEQTLHPAVCCCKRYNIVLCMQAGQLLDGSDAQDSNEPTRFGMLSSWLSVSAANYMADLCHWLI